MKTPRKSIVILHDNDVHCAVDGYSKMAGLRNAILAADTAHVLVVSSGDFINGGLIGTLSKGADIVEIMNAVGYDASTLGNHAFDFGEDQLWELVAKFGGACLATNFTYEDTDAPVFDSYLLKDLGDRKIAFLGCTTPLSMKAAASIMHDKDGNLVRAIQGERMASIVQQQVDKLRAEGADYIILLSHLGENEIDAECEWISTRLISDTHGIDVVFDAHTHHVIADSLIIDKSGENVHLTQTGTEFGYIGKMWISADGKSMSTSLIPVSEIAETDAKVQQVVDGIRQKVEALTSREVGTVGFELLADSPEEKEIIRKEETNFGDLAADAFAYAVGAQIGIAQSGGIKHNLHSGTIILGDLINTFIYNNQVKKLSMSGAQIRNLLTQVTKSLPYGSSWFPQVSGIRFTAHITEGAVAIEDLQVIDPASNQYVPIDENALYTVGITEFYPNLLGEIFKTSSEIEYDKVLMDYECVAKFIEEKLNGEIPTIYASPQGRIIIKNDTAI